MKIKLLTIIVALLLPFQLAISKPDNLTINYTSIQNISVMAKVVNHPISDEVPIYCKLAFCDQLSRGCKPVPASVVGLKNGRSLTVIKSFGCHALLQTAQPQDNNVLVYLNGNIPGRVAPVFLKRSGNVVPSHYQHVIFKYVGNDK